MVKMTASISTDTYFKFDSAALTPKATAILNQLLQDLDAQGYADNIKLTGHTCDIGTKEYNKRLSMRRAGSVKSYFVEKGSISANRIEALGMGEAAPRYPNTRGERFKNRRVDIEYLSYVSKEELVQVPAPGTVPGKYISGEAGSTPVATVVGAGVGGSAPGTSGIAGQPSSAKTAVSNPEASARQPEMPVVIEWSRQEVELEPAWIQRALFHSLPHKRTVDTYVQVRESTSTSTSRSYINRLPMAADDSYTMDGAGVTSFPVLLNDSDPDGNTLSIASVTSAQYGSVSISGTQLVYTPSVMITQATDSFTYTVSDGNGGTATARVTVRVSVNGVPLARDDRFLVSGLVPSRLDVLSNDLDPDRDPLNIVGFSQPSAGQINLEGSLLVFNPYGIFTGDTFSYTISDGRGGEATALVLLIDP
ncbi:MAG: cadherin-like domain-containing protein [Hydrogenophilales bacterium]|nr:cadherin-like domain-containing protein [Hydrogenophilales bacterium]